MDIMQSLRLIAPCAALALLALNLPARAEDKLEEPPVIMTMEPIIIEGEPIKDNLTPEEIRKKISDALGEPRKEVLRERWVSSDTVLVETRGSKYCVKFVPPNMQSSIGPVTGVAGACVGF